MPAQFRATLNKLTGLRSIFLGDVLKIKQLHFPGFLPFGARQELESCHSYLYATKEETGPFISWWTQSPLCDGSIQEIPWYEGNRLSWDTPWALELVSSPSHLQVPLTGPGRKVPWKILSNNTEIHLSDGSEAILSPQSTKLCHCFFPEVQETSDLFSFRLSEAQGIFGKN